eukprot:7501258-Lingulodinium_polyedra.AAC.1
MGLEPAPADPAAAPVPAPSPPPAPNAGPDPAPPEAAPGWAIREVGTWRFVAIIDPTRAVGRLNYIKRSIKATCSLHPGC